MARVINAPAGLVEIIVENVDDGAGVFINNNEVLHVHYRQSDSISQELTPGEQITLRFEVYNLTGGPWQATFSMNAAGQRIYNARPRGWTLPGWNVAYRDDFVLRAVSPSRLAGTPQLEEVDHL